MLSIRAETAGDAEAVRRVNELAFGRREEAALVDALRASGCPLVSLVAVEEGEVVGHLLFSPMTFEDDGGDALGDSAFRWMGLAPMAVLPSHQSRGVGSRLVREGLGACRRLGCGAVFVLGHPAYYPRFGFAPASLKGLRSVYAVPDEAFMVVELEPGALDGRGGLVRYRPEFGSV